MTHDEMIAVIQHHKNGGKVECKHKDAREWNRASLPLWNFEEYDYRAKPEPLVLWHLRTEDGEGYGTYYNREPAESVKVDYDKSHVKKLTLKKFVEVTE